MSADNVERKSECSEAHFSLALNESTGVLKCSTSSGSAVPSWSAPIWW
jgi:hypothetical protein